MSERYQSSVVAYEPKFDRMAYANVEVKDIHRLNAYTVTQLETHLGERLNVVLSTTRYEIKDGQIFGENTTEPFMHMLKRGRDYRRLNGKSIDFAREDAEVLGFEKISELANKDAKVGKMKISISAPGDTEHGSIYNHNFYDVFTLKENTNGKYIEARRYSSSLTLEETAKRLKKASLIEDDFSINPENFLENPIDIPLQNFKTADDVHQYLHENHDFATQEEFNEVKRMTAFLAISYVKSLIEYPEDENYQLLHLNAYLNAGDIALSFVRGKNTISEEGNLNFQYAFYNPNIVYELGSQPVRIVDTGCGSSGGFTINAVNIFMKSPFSVSEFATKNQEWFTCPKCTYKADGPIGNKCPGCGITKEEYSQESTITCD